MPGLGWDLCMPAGDDLVHGLRHLHHKRHLLHRRRLHGGTGLPGPGWDVLMPAGDSKTKTKIEREHGPDTKITTKVDNDKPRFQVMSVKELAEPCM